MTRFQCCISPDLVQRVMSRDSGDWRSLRAVEMWIECGMIWKPPQAPPKGGDVEMSCDWRSRRSATAYTTCCERSGDFNGGFLRELGIILFGEDFVGGWGFERERVV